MRAIARRLAEPQAQLRLAFFLLIALVLLASAAAFAHDISEADRAAVQRIEGPAPFAFTTYDIERA